MPAIATRTAALLDRMPNWFTVQAVEAVKSRQQLQATAGARQASADRRRELEFLCGVEVVESDFGEWADTVAAFNHPCA